MDEGWLIYHREDYEKNRPFADLLRSAAREHGLNLVLKFAEDLRPAIGQSGVSILMPGDRPPMFVLNRTRDWLMGRALEQAGARVFNTSAVARVGNDKIQSHLLAAELGLPQVDMVFCANEPGAISGHGLGYPVVLKNPCGHGGGEVFLCRDGAELLAHASALPCGRVLVQRLCGRPSVDVRVYVLGGRVLAAVRRRSASDFRANLSLGGSVELCEPGAAELEMVVRILAALPMDYAGIDFIYDGQGRPLFNEIEDMVGSRSLYQLGGFDVAGLYLAHVAATLENRNQQPI